MFHVHKCRAAALESEATQDENVINKGDHASDERAPTRSNLALLRRGLRLRCNILRRASLVGLPDTSRASG